jgi:V-type H+-transporting ATPase subunit E
VYVCVCNVLLLCSSGGLVLTSADGRIVCRNTLDHRVHIAYEANLPDIRAKLFGTAASGTH